MSLRKVRLHVHPVPKQLLPSENVLTKLALNYFPKIFKKFDLPLKNVIVKLSLVKML